MNKSLIIAQPAQPSGEIPQRWSVLHQAARHGDADIVRFLIRRGARLDITNCDGKTPAEIAQDMSIKLLLEHAGSEHSIENLSLVPQTFTRNFARSVMKSTLIGDRNAFVDVNSGTGAPKMNIINAVSRSTKTKTG